MDAETKTQLDEDLETNKILEDETVEEAPKKKRMGRPPKKCNVAVLMKLTEMSAPTIRKVLSAENRWPIADDADAQELASIILEAKSDSLNARLTKIKIRLAEQQEKRLVRQNLKDDDKLLDVSEVEKRMGTFVSGIKSVIEQKLITELPVQLAGLSTPEAVRVKLNAVYDELMLELRSLGSIWTNEKG